MSGQTPTQNVGQIQTPDGSPRADGQVDASDFSTPERCQRLSLLVLATFGDLKFPAIVDTAAQTTLISTGLYRRTHGVEPCVHSAIKMKLSGLGGVPRVGWRIPNFPFRIGNKLFDWSVTVTDMEDPMLLGLDFIKFHQATVNLTDNTLVIGDDVIQAELSRGRGVRLVRRAFVSEKNCDPAEFTIANESEIRNRVGGRSITMPRAGL